MLLKMGHVIEHLVKMVVSQFDFLNHTVPPGRASPKALPDACTLASASARGMQQADSNID